MVVVIGSEVKGGIYVLSRGNRWLSSPRTFGEPWGKYSTPTILCHNIYLRPGPLAKKAVTQDENMSIGDSWKVGEYLDTEVLLTVVEEIRGG